MEKMIKMYVYLKDLDRTDKYKVSLTQYTMYINRFAHNNLAQYHFMFNKVEVDTPKEKFTFILEGDE